MKVTFQVRELGIFLALVLLFVFFSFATPHFFNAGNLLNIIRQVSLIGIIFLLTVAVAFLVYGRTLLGFRMRAVGGSARAALAAGIDAKVIKIAAFAITAFFCAVGGLLNLAFLANVQGTTGTGLELDVIAAVIIGGTSLKGGEGTILGTLIGVLIMGTLKNGIILMGVSPFWQMLIVGVVIIAAVAIDMWTKATRPA